LFSYVILYTRIYLFDCIASRRCKINVIVIVIGSVRSPATKRLVWLVGHIYSAARQVHRQVDGCLFCRLTSEQ